jgi:Flp pilus assembly pilin Flp
MKQWFLKIRRDQRGQTATEYMLIIAVIVVAVVVIGKKVFVDQFFSKGVDAAGKTVQKYLECDPNVNQNC